MVPAWNNPGVHKLFCAGAGDSCSTGDAAAGTRGSTAAGAGDTHRDSLGAIALVMVLVLVLG